MIQHQIMPKPMDDLAQAIRFIRQHEKMFGVDGERYIVCGFSAGGNLAGQWGTVNHGYKTYNLPKPKALFLIYPAINLNTFKKNKNTEKFMVTMLGKGYSQKDMDAYNIDNHMDKDYPPSYIACCRDDDAVPCANSILLKERLEQLKILTELEIGEKGGHGFGTGNGTDVEGWMERAIAFAEKI